MLHWFCCNILLVLYLIFSSAVVRKYCQSDLFSERLYKCSCLVENPVFSLSLSFTLFLSLPLSCLLMFFFPLLLPLACLGIYQILASWANFTPKPEIMALDQSVGILRFVVELFFIFFLYCGWYKSNCCGYLPLSSHFHGGVFQLLNSFQFQLKGLELIRH